MEKNKLMEIFNLIDVDDVDKVKELVVNATNFEANTFLCYAAENNAINTLKFFLAAPGVDPTMQNNYPIRIAHAKGYTDCVNILAADSRVDKSVLDDENLKVKTLESKIQEMLDVDSNTNEEVVEENTSTETALPEVEEDLEEIEEMEEEKAEEIVEEILEELDEAENNKSTKEEKEFGRKVVIDRKMTSGIFESLGAKKKTKEEEDAIFSDVEKNLQLTVESTVNNAKK